MKVGKLWVELFLVEKDRQMCMIVHSLLWNNTNDWRKLKHFSNKKLKLESISP